MAWLLYTLELTWFHSQLLIVSFCLVNAIVQLQWLLTTFYLLFQSSPSLISLFCLFFCLLADSLNMLIEGRTVRSVCLFIFIWTWYICLLICLYCVFVEWHQYGLPAYPIPLSFLSHMDPSLNFYLLQFSFKIFEKFCAFSLSGISPSSQDLNVIISDFVKDNLPIFLPCLFLYYHVRHDAKSF